MEEVLHTRSWVDIRGGERCRFEVEEIAHLLGHTRPHAARRCLGRLQAAGLVRWSERGFGISEGRENETWAGLERERAVPVPRRIIRAIASGMFSRSEIATILAHLFRWVRRTGTAAVSATWAAETFDVDESGVHRARRRLEQIGWLVRIETPHWHRQRYGIKARINAAWSPVENHRVLVETPCMTAASTPARCAGRDPDSPTPESHQHLPSLRREGDRHQRPRTERPTLTHVLDADLVDTDRLFDLFRDYCAKGFAEGSDRERLRFVAAAERALRKADRNAPGFFVRIVRRQLWNHLSGLDFEAAHARLRRPLALAATGLAGAPA